jgi:hypothetical protein
VTDVYTLDPEHGWVPAIPEPFWYKGWRTLFRYRPSCYQCGNPLLFKTRREWEAHYRMSHLGGTWVGVDIAKDKDEGHQNFRP